MEQLIFECPLGVRTTSNETNIKGNAVLRELWSIVIDKEGRVPKYCGRQCNIGEQCTDLFFLHIYQLWVSVLVINCNKRRL